MSIVDDLKFWTTNAAERLPLRRWLWRSYLRSALVPLLVIELGFLGVYWASNSIVYQQNVAAVRSLSNDVLSQNARRLATATINRLTGVSNATDLLARQTLAALDGNYDPPAEEKRRYGPGAGARGGLRTLYDNGTTASLYSNLTPIGAEQMAKVWRLAVLDPLMIDLKRSDAEIASLYVNTFDSYNRIYPYFDVASQYPADMNIPTYNFYYEADAAHNPARRPVWTDAYIDPAGHGWMVSSIAPVWRGDKLEAVVGIDITLETIIQRLVSMKLPWKGYAILVDRAGGIIAMPPAAEPDFGLQELTSHHYSEAIRSDTFKPEQFNINHRSDTRILAAAMRAASDGLVELQLRRKVTAAYSTVPGTGWRLVIVAPHAEMFAEAEALSARMQTVGLAMVLALLVFYILFLAMLFRRARAMSARVAAPLQDISQVIDHIAVGEYRQQFGGSQIIELDALGHRLVETGIQLDEAHTRIIRQERIVSEALSRQQQVNADLGRFVRTMSHELRTPLAVIDSGAQILNRKADSLSPDALRDRAGRMRKAVGRISDLLHTLVEAFERDGAAVVSPGSERHLLGGMVSELAADIIPAKRLALSLPEDDVLINGSQSWAVAIRAVLDNARRYSPPESMIRVVLELSDQQAVLTIRNEGPGIPASEMPKVGSRFFRGTTAMGTEGAGVGLYVARKIVHAAGGGMDIASDPNGTLVTFTMPVGSPDETP